MVRYMVVSREVRGKRYLGSWSKNYKNAAKLKKKLQEWGIKSIITKKPKKYYNF